MSERDIRGLLFVGRGYEVAKYQVHEAIFPGLAECIPSLWAQRMAKHGAIAIERWAKVGINRLRLTSGGVIPDMLAIRKPREGIPDFFSLSEETGLMDGRLLRHAQDLSWVDEIWVTD